MSYWKSKVLPKIQKIFDKGKKKGAGEVCKTFDKSKESLDKEFEEKGADLNPKVVEIYRSLSTFTSKRLLKEPNEAAVKENPDVVKSVLEELVKAGFPGAQVICDAGSKFGPALLPGPVVYLFQKASVYLVAEDLPEEPKPSSETREVPVEDMKPAGEAVQAEIPPLAAAPPPPVVVAVDAAATPAAEAEPSPGECEERAPVAVEKQEETEEKEIAPAATAAVTETPPTVDIPTSATAAQAE